MSEMIQDGEIDPDNVAGSGIPVNRPSSAVNGRSVRGTFLPGNRYGRGRPPGSSPVPHTYHEAILSSCSPAELAEVVRRAVKDAQAGDHHARMFLIRAIGIDRLTLAFVPTTPAPFPFDLSQLEDEELAELTRLLAKVRPKG